MRPFAWMLAAFLFVGCVRVSVTPYRTLAPKAAAEEVEVFSERKPDREFEEIGLIEVTGAQATGYGALVQRAQREAAKLGADAILVSRRPIEGASAILVDGPLQGASISENETPRIWVVAIVWES